MPRARRAVLCNWRAPGNRRRYGAVLVFRIVLFLLLAVAAALFGAYAATGKPRYKRLGLTVTKWTVIAALGFFAGLVIERLMADPAA